MRKTLKIVILGEGCAEKENKYLSKNDIIFHVVDLPIFISPVEGHFVHSYQFYIEITTRMETSQSQSSPPPPPTLADSACAFNRFLIKFILTPPFSSLHPPHHQQITAVIIAIYRL